MGNDGIFVEKNPPGYLEDTPPVFTQIINVRTAMP
jgi:hypothetical protein